MRAIYPKEILQRIFRSFGYEVHKSESYDPVMEEEFKELAARCRGYHLQSVPRLYSLYQAIKYIEKHRIEGDVVECGVFKGASLMFASALLKSMGSVNRNIYLYDTFGDWPERDERDTVIGVENVTSKTIKTGERKDYHAGLGISLDEVRKNVFQTGYPQNKFIFVKGKVEETIPGKLPEKIALLRLDTDWYESTYHELLHLFPRLASGGILILDDYGHWKGAKDATDRYFEENKVPIFLNRIDYTGRIGVKPA